MKTKINQRLAVIIMAAGLGKRMGSKLPKVLHQISGKTLIKRSLENFETLNPNQIVIVASPNNLRKIKKDLNSHHNYALQIKPTGTAGATSAGLKRVKKEVSTILVANADDSVFYKLRTLKRVINRHIETKSVQTIITIKVDNPNGLGRVIKKNGKIVKIVEEKDVTRKQKEIKEVNAGLYVFKKSWLKKNLGQVRSSPITGEKYLVDLIDIANQQNQKITSYLLKDQNQWHGINTSQELKKANEKFSKKIHIMGIAGAGASAVAGIAAGLGYDVSGCDIKPISSYLKNSRLAVKKGHHSLHLHNIGRLIVSPAVIKNDANNTELKEAEKQKIPIITWQEFQGKYLQDGKFVISIAGGYGKSTTTAMISQVFIDAGLDPTCEVGATVLAWQKNFRVGKSRYYINEADEYNDNFLNYHPDIAVILNLAWDHPDYFKNKMAVLTSYKKFIANIKRNGYLVVGKSQELSELVNSARSDVRIVKMKDFGGFKLSIIGKFRKDNASIALTVAEVLKLGLKNAKKSVQNFKGVGRRLQYKGKVKGVKVYDDYAVQPYTIKTTANALKEKYQDKHLALVYEPHTFSRVKTFFDDFVSSLKATNADEILITNVFAAREKGNERELSQKLTKSIGSKAIYTESIDKTAAYLKKRLKNLDVILSMGAGDVYKIYDLLK